MERKRNIIMAISFIAIILASAFGISFHEFKTEYKNKFLPGSTIGDISVAKLTSTQAMDRLKNEYKIDIKFREGKKETLLGKDIDFRFSSADVFEKAINKNTYVNYLKGIINPKEVKLGDSPIYSRDLFEKKIRGWEEFDKKKMRPALDARVVYEKGKFSIAKQEKGTVIDTDLAKSVLESSIKELDSKLDYTKTDGVYKDDFKKINKDSLERDKAALEKMQWSTITYELPDGSKKVLDASTTMNWLERDAEGGLSKETFAWNANLEKYVETLAKEVDTVGKPRSFKTHSGSLIKLTPTRYYGWEIDTEKEIETLKENLATGEKIERKPNYSMTEKSASNDNYGFGKTYIEVDLGSQHLWYYKEGKVSLETDVVSGKLGGYSTPSGSFAVLNKARNIVLRGPSRKETTVKTEGSGDKKKEIKTTKTVYEWESPVSYWLPIDFQGTGLHDAPWRGVFGGSVWMYGGSHGCVNLPPSKAAQLFNMVEVGTPVAIYY